MLKLVFFILTILTLFQCVKSPNPQKITKHIPKFKVISPDGSEVISNESIKLNAKYIYVFHFWGTWCYPCVEELPKLIKLAKKFEDKKIRFILWSIDDKRENIAKFLNKFSPLPSNISIVKDTSSRESTPFDFYSVPQSYVYGSDGTGFDQFSGPQNWGDEYYELYLRKKLSY